MTNQACASTSTIAPSIASANRPRRNAIAIIAQAATLATLTSASGHTRQAWAGDVTDSDTPLSTRLSGRAHDRIREGPVDVAACRTSDWPAAATTAPSHAEVGLTGMAHRTAAPRA